MSAVLASEDYTSVIRVGDRPILPPLMTENRRKEMQEWREKAMQVSVRISERAKTPEVVSPVIHERLQYEEETSPVLTAYASRFGSRMEMKKYLSGFVSNSPPPISHKSSPPRPQPTLDRAAIRASIAELDKERDESIQRFLEEQSRQLVNLKKSFAEQRRKLLQQITQSAEKRSLSRGSSTSNTRITHKHKKVFAKLSALVKGYLVRRLMATVKVQDILSSLKDSLKMALQLHQEAARNHKSNESDINLHKTLLQQINRDVKKFHDIFFQLSTEEKMKLIAMDREDRKKEKPNKKLLSEATKQRLKQRFGETDVNKENRASPPVGKSPQVSKRSEKSKASPKKHSGSSKPSPRTMKNAKIKTSHVKVHN